MKNRATLLFSLLLLGNLTLFSCEGGVQGPVGPQGPPGADGFGARIIYEETATTDEYVVNIQELHIDDFPLIACYYFLEGSWSNLSLDYTDENGDSIFPFALIEEQRVTLIGLAGLDFKIVLVL